MGASNDDKGGAGPGGFGPGGFGGGFGPGGFGPRAERWRRRPRGVKILMALVFVALALGVVGLVVMGLWNALVPALFGGPAVSWVQGLGLFALGRLLFGGWGRGRMGGGRHWRQRMDERMASLSPEERERMKAMLARRCGPGWRGPDEAAGTAG